MNADCGICRQSFKTGDSTMMVERGKIRAAVHTACKAQQDGKFIRNYHNTPGLEDIESTNAALHSVGPKKVLARALPAAAPKFDSRLEAAYWERLQAQLKIGEIVRVDHHPEKLHLGGGRWYTPDFRVVQPDGLIIFDEVKGGFAREAAMVRLDVAAASHPYIFRLVRLAKGSSTSSPKWEITRVGDSTA